MPPRAPFTPPRRRALALLSLAWLPAGAWAAPGAQDEALILALIDQVRRMPSMRFIRNGQAHDGAEAARHLQAKYEHFRSSLTTAEDFIDRCGSRSEMTGRPYKVRLGDGREQEADVFLRALLRTLRESGARRPA